MRYAWQRIMHGASSRLGPRTLWPMPLHDPPLDATIHVVTPENIAFEYRLAGPFRRLPAFLLDFCIGTAIFIVMTIVISLTVSFASPYLAFALMFLLFFRVWWFYGVLFETFINGQT